MFKTRQEKLAFTHKRVVNIYIVYEINLWPYNVIRYFVLGNSFFGAVKLTKNFDKYKYSDFGIGFDARESFLLPNVTGFGKNNNIWN